MLAITVNDLLNPIASHHKNNRRHSASRCLLTGSKKIYLHSFASAFRFRVLGSKETMRITVAVISLCIIAVNARTLEKDDNPPGKKFVESLPECERPDFITYELGRGYSRVNTTRSKDRDIVFPDALDIPDELIEKFEALEAPDNFTTNLYKYVENEFHLDDAQILTLILTRAVCFENGDCIDIDDVGSLCCPF